MTAPRKCQKLIASGNLSFGESVVLHRVVGIYLGGLLGLILFLDLFVLLVLLLFLLL